ncbi:protein kinase domain-containing protein [Streptomyces sp. DT24]|uniref:protein kinase domain-containing protein n=1 Tax=Streptomyces sp. DT24 TaxID=3416520 RepID=UPI003CF48FCF
MNSASHHIGPDSAPDRYRLLNSIGRGGEAVLYRAEIELGGEPETVVVKVLDSKTTITIEQFQRLSAKWQEQAELLRFVNRPGVVGVREHFEGPPIHGSGESGTAAGRALVLVMNHVDGLDLRDWRAERTLSSHAERREVLRTLEQLADVLDWLHSGKAAPSGRTVVHGDLSPGNVMVDAHGQATLVDFGLSKLTADHQTAEVWFTPGYAAPEVFEGKRSPGTDKYAFGAIAYFLLSGQAPPSSPEQLRAALGALPEVAAVEPERAERILSVCAADPHRRPETLTAWVKDVRSAVVSTTRSGPSVRDAAPPLPSAAPAAHAAPAPEPPAVPKPPLLPPPSAEPAAGGFGPPITASADPGVPLPSTVPPTGPSGPAGPNGPAGPVEPVGPNATTPQPYPDPASLSLPPVKKKRRVLAPALAVLLAASIGVNVVQGLTKDDGGTKTGAAPGPTVTVTETAATDGSSGASGDQVNGDGEETPPDASPSPSVDLAEVTDAKEVALTTVQSVDKTDAELIVGEATFNGRYYNDTLLVDKSGYNCGVTEYNLGRNWNTFDLVAGIDDSTRDKVARLEISVDGKSLFAANVTLGHPQALSLDVRNGLRLVISYPEVADTCPNSLLALGSPVLRK